MNSRLGWVGMVLFSVLAGCAPHRVATTEHPATSSAASYYPLAVGNRWTYQASFLGQGRQTAVEIIKQENGYFLDSTGARLAVDAYGVRDQKRYLLREPLETGRTWTNVVSVSSVEHYQILEAGQSCDVPAGHFESCVRVEARNRVDQSVTLVNELTFAPNVGIARIRVFAETANGRRIPQSELQLQEYHLVDSAKAR